MSSNIHSVSYNYTSACFTAVQLWEMEVCMGACCFNIIDDAKTVKSSYSNCAGFCLIFVMVAVCVTE